MKFVDQTNPTEVIMVGRLDADGDFEVSATVAGTRVLILYIPAGMGHIRRFWQNDDDRAILEDAGFEIDDDRRVALGT